MGQISKGCWAGLSPPLKHYPIISTCALSALYAKLLIAAPRIQLGREPSLAEIRPFQGVHYNQSLVKDLTKVLCPPYDIITPQLQQQLHQQSEANFVRVELGREFPQDKDSDNKYTRARDTIEKWLEQGILQVDEAPAIYTHDHHFAYQGKKYCRRSITCLVKLEAWDRLVIRPHEGTLPEPRDNRLSMLWTLQANTSPILALYEDRENVVSSLLEVQSRGEPILSANADNGEAHHLWAIRDTKAITPIYNCLASQPLYIADGHHRYESALAYQRERRTGSSSELGQEPYDFVMMTLVDFSHPGLIILPAHRLIRGMSKSILDGLMTGLGTFFSIEELPLNRADINQQINDLLSEETGKVKIVLYGLLKERLLVLKLHDYSTVNHMIPYFHSEIYHRLDVSIVDHVILEELMGLAHDISNDFIAYSYEALDAINMVLDQEYQLAFIVNPVKSEMIRAIADSGDRMPRKSTYFYPKMPAGLVFYRFASAYL